MAHAAPFPCRPPHPGSRGRVPDRQPDNALAASGWVGGAWPVPSVDQALDLIEEDRPDAAVLDVNLGDAIPSIRSQTS